MSQPLDLGFPRRRLLARCQDANPRLIRLVARPGWGKTTFARQIAATTGRYAVCDCSGLEGADELEARLATAVAGDPATLVIDGAEGLVAVAGAVDLVQRAIERTPAGRLIVVAGRETAGIGPSRNIAPHEGLTLNQRDLAFDAAEVRELFADLPADELTLEAVIALAGGWAIAIFLLARLAREGVLREALADPGGPYLDDLYAYAQRETLATWSEPERAGIAAVAAVPGATVADVEAIAGTDACRALDSLAVRGGPVVREVDRYVIGELVRHAVRRLLPDVVARARDAGVARARATGSRIRAAEILLTATDHRAAAAELEALAAADPIAAQTPAFVAVASELPIGTLLGTCKILVTVLESRATQANPVQLLARVEQIAARLEYGNDPEFVAGTKIAHGALSRALGRHRDARRIFDEVETLDDPSPERAALVQANLGAIAAVQGRLTEAAERFARAGVPSSGPTLFRLERFELEVARRYLKPDPERARAAYQRNIDEAREWGPAAVVHALRYAAAGAWVAGDDPGAAAIIEEISRLEDEAATTFRTVRATRPRLHERVLRINRWVCLWYLNAALLADDAHTARRFIEIAIDGYRELGAAFWEMLASLVGSSIPHLAGESLEARARALAEGIDGPVLVAAVNAVLERRREGAGILSPLLRRIEQSRALRASQLRIEVLTGRVVAGDDVLTLRERELELLVMLALEQRSLTRDTLVAQLWPGTETEEGTAALRTAVYRLRKQLRDPAAIASTPSGYRLSDTVPVDTVEAERFLVGIRRVQTWDDGERARLVRFLDVLSAGIPSMYKRWEWFAPYESRFGDLLHDVGVLLAEDDLRRGDNAAAIERIETLLRADPLDEPANEIAIRAHLAAGRKSEALRRYRRYRDALEREYGTQPDRTLGALLAAE